MSVLKVTIENLPEMIDTQELAELLRLDIEQTRKIVRRNKDVLRPFKLGRDNRFLRENVEVFYNLLTSGKVF